MPPTRCPHCGLHFENGLEIEQHYAEVHDKKWTGNVNQSQSSDLDAVGAVSPRTPDTVATHGGVDRPSAEERARVRQGRD